MAYTEEQKKAYEEKNRLREDYYQKVKEHQNHLKDLYTIDQLQSLGGNTSKAFNCFNPEHPGGRDNGKHAKYIKAKNWVNCARCPSPKGKGQTFDLFRMIGIEIGSNDFKEQYAAACRKFNDGPPEPPEGLINEEWPRKTSQEARKQEERGNIPETTPNAVNRILEPQAGNSEEEARKKAAEEARTLEYARKLARAVLDESMKQMKAYPEEAIAYLEGRGFTKEIIEAEGIGFLKDYPPDPELNNRVIFPTKNGGYIGRSILSKSEDEALDRKKYKKAWKLGAELYNVDLLQEAGTGPIFITEGEIDAMTIGLICGYPAIGLSGTPGMYKLIEAGKKAKQSITQEAGKALIILPDNDEDETGQKAAADLLKLLREEGIPALIIESLTERAEGEKKADVNSNYVKDPEGFQRKLGEAVNAGYAFALDPEAVLKEERAAKLKEYDKGTHTNIAEDFRAWAIERASKPCIPTGFKLLDGLLNGGLREELYILGGIPSSGKTTFALQLADQIAEAGEDVLFFALEQGKYELTSKSISRLTWEEATPQERAENLPRTNIGVIDALGFKGETDAEKKIQGLVNRSMNRYKSFSGRVRIIEAGSELTPSKMAEAVDLHMNMIGNKPVVILDYLQLLGIDNKKIIDPKPRIDQAISDLARLCREKLIPVIVISSLNRDGYEKGGMANLKESGNLEYSAQVVLLLGFRRSKDSKQDLDDWIDEESLRSPREVYVKISKHKNAEKGKPVSFDYYAVHNRFKEIGIMERKKK